MRNEEFRCGRRPRIENLGWWRRFALALVTGRQNLSQGSRLSPARAGLRQAARSAPGGVPAQPEGTKARPGAAPLRPHCGHLPLQGRLLGGSCLQSLPCKGRWHRVSDDGRVHCRFAMPISCRVVQRLRRGRCFHQPGQVCGGLRVPPPGGSARPAIYPAPSTCRYPSISRA